MKNKLLYILACCLCFIGCSDETKVQSVRLEPTELTLNIGETRQIEMLIEPISAIIYNPVAWKTSNPNVAQVDNKGNITAVYAGECLITCKTKHHEAYCQVTVVAPKYNFAFTNGIVFDEGIKPDIDQRNLILRLYDDNLTIDSTGAMSGNGLFLNINLYAPSNSEQLPIGEYHTSDTINDYTIMPGTLRQEGNAYYATGSYLGQYTDNGLSAIFLTEGNVIVENNGNYTITCSFTGSQTEIIDATFNGTINTYDTSEENQVTTIEYSDFAHEAIEIEEEPTLNHIKIALSHNDTIITFVARTPKSITSLPFGNYYLSDNVIAYTLVPNRCQMLIADKVTTIITASLQIKENECYGSFTDSEGNKYLVKKQDNIRKQQIKSFVY
jgi:hypothetical protein